ncbi:MBL fold metallo-hydrolase [Streptomyces sp. ST2-7A]|uniref:MBL fold metallo-hydrolase n=1 Tax=Streptomyces sp. ST2-7A TaxID=2907214 RepID=UPI001F288D1A|nr:MBL fold metallo-hydrolase [Streptomyces sp. ST2-7A]MCE7081641.1 MBL fold metallo-hydrolase [Streptomyces sp. ST2-7A]
MAVEITWWGHATASVRDSGTTVLTDPLFPRWLYLLRRRTGAVPPTTAHRADVAVISHLHGDHLHLASLGRMEPGTTVVLPRGAVRAVPALRRLARRRGLELREVAAGDSLSVGTVRVRAVPAAHDGRRRPGARLRVEPLGFVIEGRARTYYAGDTGWFPGMAEAVGRVDTALLPVGGWGPFLGPGHLDAREAARVAALLAPAAAVPVHFGTFWPLGLEGVRPHEFSSPGDEFVRHTGRLAPGVRVHLLAPGQSVRPVPGNGDGG